MPTDGDPENFTVSVLIVGIAGTIGEFKIRRISGSENPCELEIVSEPLSNAIVMDSIPTLNEIVINEPPEPRKKSYAQQQRELPKHLRRGRR